MSPVEEVQWLAGLRFPRVSGDEPPLDDVHNWDLLFSPRERG